MERTGSLPVTMPNVKEESNRDIEEEYFGEFFKPLLSLCLLSSKWPTDSRARIRPNHF